MPFRNRGISLRTQVGATLAGLAVAFFTTMVVVQCFVVFPWFADLERTEAEKDLHRCADGVEAQTDILVHLTLDWSAWDELYEYAQDRNTKFEQTTLNTDACEHAHVNLLAIIGTNNELLWSEVRDLENGEEIQAPELLELIRSDHPMIQGFDGDMDYCSGLLPTKRGPLMFAARPIVNSAGQGPSRGTIVMGRFLDDAMVKEIGERIHIAMQTWDLSPNETSFDGKLPREIDYFNGNKWISIVDRQTLHAFTTLHDVFGRPAVLIRANLAREVTAHGRFSVYAATVCGLAAVIVTITVLWFVLQFQVVKPLMEMAAHAKRIGETDNLRNPLKLKRNDEIGSLATAFDEMVACLAESRKKVLDSAHREGMAEIASEVLHNVGNAVTSAYCSVEVLDDLMRKSKLPGLKQATKLLQQNAPNASQFFDVDPRGKKLIEYLVALAENLEVEQQENVLELQRIRQTVSHIRDAIAAQQEIARQSHFRQETDLEKLIDDALHINQSHLDAHQVIVQKHVESLPELMVNKSKLSQVMVNLIRNAIHAMADSSVTNRILAIQVNSLESGDIKIEIRDTGCGFPAEVSSRLFSHGFTTKASGNGLGLHFCANAIKEMGGSISAQSAGPGRGALFQVILPESIRPNSINLASPYSPSVAQVCPS